MLGRTRGGWMGQRLAARPPLWALLACPLLLLLACSGDPGGQVPQPSGEAITAERVEVEGFGLARAVEEMAVISNAGRAEIIAHTAQREHQVIIIKAASREDFLTVIVVYRREKHLAGLAIQPGQGATLKAVAIGPGVSLIRDLVNTGIKRAGRDFVQ